MTDQPNRDSILANLNRLRETTEAQAAVEGDYAPAFTPKTIQPKPTTFRKGGLMEQAAEVSLSEADKQMTELIDNLPALEAVKIWGKPQKDYRSVGPQSVLIRCPKPEHPDNNPSTTLDLIENVWRCHACAEGGDIYTMGAIHHGTTTDPGNFRDLKKKMAMDLGVSITESGGNATIRIPGQAPQAPQPSAPVMPSNPAPSTIIKLDDGSYLDQSTGELVDTPVRPQPVQLTGGVFGDNAVVTPAPALTPQPVEFDDEKVEEISTRLQPEFDWLPIGRNGSFIDRYMNCLRYEEYPDSLGFSAALMCLSFIADRRVTAEMRDPLLSNFGMIMVAESGVGKSRAFGHASKVLNEAMPFRDSELAIGMSDTIVPSSGVKFVTGAGSGENIIRQFDSKVPVGQKADGSTEYERSTVRGIISYDELATLISKASNKASTVKNMVMKFLDGAPEVRNDTNTNGNDLAHYPFACLHAGVQPGALHDLLTQGDDTSGFINRFVFFTGSLKPRQNKKLPMTDMSDGAKAFKDLKDFWDAQGDVLLDDSLIWDKRFKYLDEVSDEYQRRSGKDIFKRLDVILNKMIVLLCINEKSTVITPDILDKAIHLHSYFIKTFQYVSAEIYNPILSPSVDSLEDRIVKRIIEVANENKAAGKQLPEEFAVGAKKIRDSAVRSLLRKSPLGESGALTKALKSLVDVGDVKSINTSRGLKYYVE